MEVYDGLTVNAFATEPMLVNPTNIDIDEKGRIWMCEATNYRMRFNPKNPYRDEGDRILILEDEDGDGLADTKKVFYQSEEINSALGIAVLGDKVYVSHSPSILILSDTDGDDVADTKDTLFTGIGGVQDDHGVHAISFGMDGKLYFNFGNAGKQLLYKDGSPVLDIEGQAIKTDGKSYRQGLAFRCDPDGKNVEVIGHNFRNIYEIAVDSYGTKWQSDNDDDGNKGVRINYVMEHGNYGYKDEINGNSWNVRRIGMHDEIPQRHWHQNDPGVVPNLLQTGSGSPCGMLIYEANLLPEVFQNQMLHCEAGHQVVRAYPVQKEGAGYRAETVNLLKSSDPWFRPSDVAMAPDGSVFVADWYDAVVGGNEMDDPDRGRIYRIAPPRSDYKITPPDLSTLEGAIEALKNPNLSTRYLGWTRLHEAGAKAEELLLDLYQNGSARAQARAFYLLVRIPEKTESYIRQGLKNENADIRIAALRAARDLMPELLHSFVETVIDDSPDVRREAAISLRYIGDYEAAKLWTKLALQYDGKDRWYLEALGIGGDKHPAHYFNTLYGHIEATGPFPHLGNIAWRMRTPYSLSILSQLITDPKISEADLARYFRAFHFHEGSQKDLAIAKLFNLNHPLKDQINAYALSSMNKNFIAASASTKTKIIDILPSLEGRPAWLTAVKVLERTEAIPQLWEMILAGKYEEVQSEALTTLFDLGGAPLVRQAISKTDPVNFNKVLALIGPINHSESINILKEQLNRKDLQLSQRKKITEALGDSWDGVHFLYELAKAGKLDKELHTTAALKMMTCWDTDVRWYGPKLLDAATNSQGKQLSPIDELIDLTGNPESGKKHFSEYCSSCHVVNGEGVKFGPALSEIGNKLGKKALYAAIIYPSGGISYGYEGYLLKTTDEKIYTGYIENQTEEELTLRMTGVFAKTFKQSEVVSLEPIESSLMTANLQRMMTEQQLIDLVEYLTTLRSSAE